MMEGFGSGSVPLTNGSGRPKNLHESYGSGTLQRTAYIWKKKRQEEHEEKQTWLQMLLVEAT
jgi:hypothetical protein